MVSVAWSDTAGYSQTAGQSTTVLTIPAGSYGVNPFVAYGQPYLRPVAPSSQLDIPTLITITLTFADSSTLVFPNNASTDIIGHSPQLCNAFIISGTRLDQGGTISVFSAANSPLTGSVPNHGLISVVVISWDSSVITPPIDIAGEGFYDIIIAGFGDISDIDLFHGGTGPYLTFKELPVGAHRIRITSSTPFFIQMIYDHSYDLFGTHTMRTSTGVWINELTYDPSFTWTYFSAAVPLYTDFTAGGTKPRWHNVAGASQVITYAGSAFTVAGEGSIGWGFTPATGLTLSKGRSRVQVVG